MNKREIISITSEASRKRCFFLRHDTYCRYFMGETELIELGKVIRAKRESRGLTQVELAFKSGLDRNYIGMVERGERNPSYLSLQKIAQGLGLSVDEMIKP